MDWLSLHDLHGLHERTHILPQKTAYRTDLCSILIFTVIAGSLGGCGTDTDGVVPIGPDTYMIGRLGGMPDYAGSAVKARLYAEASKYCLKCGQTMLPVTINSQDSGLATYASAEVQFRCAR